MNYYSDPDSVQWYPAANLPAAIAIHKAVSFDGKLWCLSGQPDKTLCEYYDPSSNSWVVKNPLPDQHFWYGAIIPTANSFYRFCGGAYFSPVSSALGYDEINDSWIPLPTFPMTLHALAGTSISDSLLVISGGYLNGFERDEVWIYNTNSQQYFPSDSFPVARNYHSMVRIDRCVYSIGGYNPVINRRGIAVKELCACHRIS